MHTGTVDDVYQARVPDTGKPALKVIVNVAKPELQPLGKAPTLESYQNQVAFFVARGLAPVAGDAITWDAHWCQWAGGRVKKLSWDVAP